MPFWLERLDEHYEMMSDQAPNIDRPPSEYFRGRCVLTCEPEEKMVDYVLENVGEDVICYASDYCHWDCAFPDSVKLIEERDDLDPARKAAVLAGNAAKFYGLDAS